MPRARSNNQESRNQQGGSIRLITAAVPALQESAGTHYGQQLCLPDLASAKWVDGTQSKSPVIISTAAQLGTLRRALDVVGASSWRNVLGVVELGGLLGTASQLLQPQVRPEGSANA